MRLFLLVLFFSALLYGCAETTEAQITSSSSGTVVNSKKIDNQTKKNSLGITTIDFKNFTYPIPNIGKSEGNITLKNGTSIEKNSLVSFTLRKTYYFDLTGDREDESITHIIADGCQIGCESSSLFYVHTMENDKPKLLWKIAIAGDVLGGLKAAHFDVKEFTIETFGDCTLNDWIIKANLDLKKNPKILTTNYSRYVFTFENGAFSPATKILLPLNSDLNMASYRPKISFGEQ